MVIPKGGSLDIISVFSKSEDWTRFWGHIDKLRSFSGQIHFIAYVLEKRDSSACSQPQNLQIHLPVQIWFPQGMKTRMFPQNNWNWAAAFFGFPPP